LFRLGRCPSPYTWFTQGLPDHERHPPFQWQSYFLVAQVYFYLLILWPPNHKLHISGITPPKNTNNIQCSSCDTLLRWPGSSKFEKCSCSFDCMEIITRKKLLSISSQTSN
jgi:LSD1 subclass zinc finger protein